MALSKNSSIVIVGGGIGGLFTARYLTHLGFNNITLIEQSKHPGGLLRHSEFDIDLPGIGNLEFDLGAHFILKTGNPALDQILDLDIDKNKYIEFHDSLPEGQFTNGHLYTDSGCVNATYFEPQILDQIISEMEQLIATPTGKSITLRQTLTRKYGETAYSAILDPIFTKLAGQSPEKLDPTVETTFFPSRLIVADRERSKDLKTQTGWDERIAFANYQDSTSPVVKYYPKVGTVQSWLDDLISALTSNGVKILCGKSALSAAVSDNKNITGLMVSDGNEIPCDFLFWTIPPILLSKLLKIEVPSKRPSMRSVTVIPFVSDQAAISGPFWINVTDPEKISYRVTLYDNFSPDKKAGIHRLSVEILHDGSFEASSETEGAIFDELRQMEILPNHANCLWSGSDIIPSGFPVMQPGDLELYEEQIKLLSKQVDNVHMVSRFRGGASGQMAIMGNLFQFITDKLNSTA